ncbi:hypothetical protein HDR60_04105 [bacterium]|nr:hypothetical protein [bacterium]
MRLLQTKQKREGDFLITAFFNKNTDRPNRIDVERKVPFTFNNEQVEETAILRFKDNHKKDEIYTVETIFANILIDKVYSISGFKTLHPLVGKPYKQRYNSTLKTIWEDPLRNRHIIDFMDLFNNFNYFLKKDYIFDSNQYFIHEIYKVYEAEYKSKRSTTNILDKTNEIIR